MAVVFDWAVRWDQWFLRQAHESPGTGVLIYNKKSDKMQSCLCCRRNEGWKIYFKDKICNNLMHSYLVHTLTHWYQLYIVRQQSSLLPPDLWNIYRFLKIIIGAVPYLLSIKTNVYSIPPTNPPSIGPTHKPQIWWWNVPRITAGPKLLLGLILVAMIRNVRIRYFQV